jgi:hypothetical protein
MKDEKNDSYVEYGLWRDKGLIVKCYWLLVINVTY